MLIIALVLALIGLVALVFAVVTSNELVAWVCIGVSVLGVVLLIVDALREHQHRDTAAAEDDTDDAHDDQPEDDATLDYPDEDSNPDSDTADGYADDQAVSAETRGDDTAK
ncbi:cytochrome d ubiquinol oxidase subunit II [Mycobacterium tilburgii]|uniref:cytochrome d ubiquinol oxidase subunit II n=1 Tax=Mycobacterium tilburgii TaxID=44467 RepID=UPI001183192A|nr:cytochrome d ubiquinol oxidase subunit II [Mycobacterium tilburgii]